MTEQEYSAAVLKQLDCILSALTEQAKRAALGSEHYAEHLVQFERIHGELKSQNTRIAVHEGNLQAQLSRIGHRLDGFALELKDLRDKQVTNNEAQQREIDQLKLHSRYIVGIGAGVALLLNFGKKLKELLSL